MNQFKTHIDIIDFSDEETNYLYSDVINKTLGELEEGTFLCTKREILNAYVETLCRFFRISSLVHPNYISPEELNLRENSFEVGTSIALEVLRTNMLNMLWSTKKIDKLFTEPDADYRPEFEFFARKHKKACWENKDKPYSTREFYNELSEGVIGYILIDDFVDYCQFKMHANDKRGVKDVFHFIPKFKEYLLKETNFEFVGVSGNPQSEYDFYTNTAKMWSDVSVPFREFCERLINLRNDNFLAIEDIKKGKFDNQFKQGETRQDCVDVSNLSIFLFSSLYNLVDYLLYQIHHQSNWAFDASKLLQLNTLSVEKKGKTDLLDYDKDKINGLFSKEEFEKMAGRTMKQIIEERRKLGELDEDDEDNEDEDEEDE